MILFAFYTVNCFVMMFFNSALVASTLDSILLAAVYLYTAEGKAPANFDEDLLERAIVRK